jgi:hypothetical protein
VEYTQVLGGRQRCRSSKSSHVSTSGMLCVQEIKTMPFVVRCNGSPTPPMEPETQKYHQEEEGAPGPGVDELVSTARHGKL